MGISKDKNVYLIECTLKVRLACREQGIMHQMYKRHLWIMPLLEISIYYFSDSYSNECQ